MTAAHKPAEERARADAYTMLALLLADRPSENVLGLVAGLDGDDAELGLAMRELAACAGAMDAGTIADEYEGLFIGLGRGELVPHASFYLTGFLNERPLARLRADLKKLGVERVSANKVPEDHIASLCEVMAGIIRGDFAEMSDVCQRTFFQRHLASWADRFFEDLQGAQLARFYRPVGRFGRELMRIDGVAFEMAA